MSCREPRERLGVLMLPAPSEVPYGVRSCPYSPALGSETRGNSTERSPVAGADEEARHFGITSANIGK